MGELSVAELDALIAEATVDCYGDDEQVEGLDVTGRGHVVAHCSRGGIRQAISVLDLPLPTPPPPGARWIEAYRRWAG